MLMPHKFRLAFLFLVGGCNVLALSDTQQTLLHAGREVTFVHTAELGAAGRHLDGARAVPRGGDGQGVEAPFVNAQAQQVRQKIYYSSLATFWSTVFMPSSSSTSGGPGSRNHNAGTGTGSGGTSGPAAGASGSTPSLSGGTSVSGSTSSSASGATGGAPAATRSSGTGPAAGTGLPPPSLSSVPLPASSSRPSESNLPLGASLGAHAHVAPTFVALLTVVLIAVFVAMLLQYALRRVEEAVSGEMTMQYRRAVHALYQQVVAVTLLCGATIALASSSLASSWSAAGGEFGDVQGLLVDVTVFLGLTAFVFLCCALSLVGSAFDASKRWRELEDESRYPDNIVWRFAMSLLKREGVMDNSSATSSTAKSSLRWYQCKLKELVDVDMEALGFLLLRTEFVPFVLRPPAVHYRNNRYWYFPRKRDCSALDFHFAHFDFERYLSHKSGHLLTKLLQTPLTAWLILEVLIALICLPSFAPPEAQLAIFVVLGYVLLGVAAAVTNYQRNCYQARVHESAAWRALAGRVLAKIGSGSSAELAWIKDRKKKEGQFQLISDLMAIMMRDSGDSRGYHAPGAAAADDDDDLDGDFGDSIGEGDASAGRPSVAHRVKRGCVSCLRKSRTVATGASRISGAGASAGTGGGEAASKPTNVQHYPQFSVACVRIVLLLTAVYCSVLVAAIGKFAVTSPLSFPAAVAIAFVAAVVGVVPPPLVVRLLSRAMHYNVLLAATGRNRDDGLAADVVAEGKARMARSALRVLDAMVLRAFATPSQGPGQGLGQAGGGSGGWGPPRTLGLRRSNNQARQRRPVGGNDSEGSWSEGGGGAPRGRFDSDSDHYAGRSGDDYYYDDDDDDGDDDDGDNGGGGGYDDDDAHASDASGGGVSMSSGGGGRAAAPWVLTFERLATLPAAQAASLGELSAPDNAMLFEKRVRWPEFHAWYRRWMCRSDVAVAACRIYDTCFCESPTSPTYAQVLRNRKTGTTAATDALEVGAGASTDWGSLSRRQFQRVFEQLRSVEQQLRSSVEAVEQVILDLFEVRTAGGADSSGGGGGRSGGGGGGGAALTPGHALSFVAKEVFIATTLHALGVPVGPGVTRAQVALEDELAAFFDEADATMEGFVSVTTLAQVLHRYWFWPDNHSTGRSNTNNSRQASASSRRVQ
jgi:hypothetical protein